MAVVKIITEQTKDILLLSARRDEAREHYFAHRDPGGLTPAAKEAFNLEHFAYQLFLAAAQTRLDAAVELHGLLMLTEAANG